MATNESEANDAKRDELPCLPPDLEAIVTKNATLAPRSQIGLFCYGDHNRDIFHQFVCHIIPEDYDIPLSNILLKEIFGYSVPSFETILSVLRATGALLPRKEDGVDSSDSNSDSDSDSDANFEEQSLWKYIKDSNDIFAGVNEFLHNFTNKNISDLLPEHCDWRKDVTYAKKPGCLAIRFRFQGRKYIVADTFSRNDYRVLCDQLLKEKNELWNIHHVCLITHFLKCHDKVDENLYKRNHHHSFHNLLWEPGCARDVMCVMYQTHDDNHGSLWKALTDTEFCGNGLLDSSFNSNELNLPEQNNKITNYFNKA